MFDGRFGCSTERPGRECGVGERGGVEGWHKEVGTLVARKVGA